MVGYSNSTFTKSAQDLALKSCVELINRSKLERLINNYYNQIWNELLFQFDCHTNRQKW